MYEAPDLIQPFRDKKAVEFSASALRIIADDYDDGVEEDGNAGLGFAHTPYTVPPKTMLPLSMPPRTCLSS